MKTLPHYKPPMSVAKVRTKTGCLGCRARRKKCDENRPRCLRCAKTGLDCVWPSAEQHVDRRHRARRCYPLSTNNDPRPKSGSNARMDSSSIGTVRVRHPSQKFELSRLSGATNNDDIIVVVVETAVLNHFTSSFLPLLFLSIADPCFHNDVLVRAFSLSSTYRHLEATMLACGAMHMRAMSNHVSTPKTPFHYYSDAVAAVSRTLRGELGAHGDYNALGAYNDSFDALIISIILLYIYGTWTAADIRSNEDRRHHVRGATQLLKIRYCQTTDPFPLRPIDRVIIESVLCQHFLLTARHPFFPNAFVDTEFWALMESVLGGATCSADFSTANRPILGVLIPLCRLILTIVQLNRSPLRGDAATLTATKQEMAYWEAFIEETQFENTHAMGIYNALVVEYVLAASLMLDWIVDAPPGQEAHPLSIPYGESWQLRRAIGVLKRMVYKDKWTRCYLGMWPLQILGYAVDAEGDIALIREDLDRRSHVTGMGETLMVRSELEALWRTRKDSVKGLGAASMESQTRI